MSDKTTSPIAIVGVSALFAKAADIDTFWQNILAGVDAIDDVPASHWHIEDYFDANPDAPDKTYARRGGFLPEVDFEPMAWGMPPSNLAATDTAQLLALIVAQRVLEDAAQAHVGNVAKENTSVILGVTSAQELLCTMVSRLQRPIWAKSLREAGIPDDQVERICTRIADHYVPWQEASFPGLLGNVVAGRIAQRLDLGGTNCVTDAACASAFSALSMAINELRTGQSDLVISGGVDTFNDIFMYMCFSKTPALSPTGDCRPFAEQADGTLLGEGLGMVALRRLEDAERDGQPVYAVIRGLGTSSDGRAKSVYAPLSEGQAKALRRAYTQADYAPETVELVEAHGTGTKAGDAAELGGLRQVFPDAAAPYCALGSIKSQIGHTKAAAGAAGLLKAVLALQHKVLPPTIKVDAPAKALREPGTPFYVNTEARPWIRPASHPRRASVSSFGFGGSNYHVTLEAYEGAPQAERRDQGWPPVLLLSGESWRAVNESWLAEYKTLQAHAFSVDAVRALCSAAQRRAHEGCCRLAYCWDVTGNLSDQAIQLHQWFEAKASGRDVAALPRLVATENPTPGPVACLFPGQGSQCVGMAAALAKHCLPAQHFFDRAVQSVPWIHGICRHIFPIPAWTDEERRAQTLALRHTSMAQPALALANGAFWSVLQAAQVPVAGMLGHSFGELSALYSAGAFELPTLLELAAARGSAMGAVEDDSGGMLAISAPSQAVEALLADYPDAVLANRNTPTQNVVSGPVTTLVAIEARCQEFGLASTRLPVSHAFHSPAMQAARDGFSLALDSATMRNMRCPVYANTTAEPYPENIAAIRAGLSEQLTSPVRFAEAIECLAKSDIQHWVEVGPKRVLSGLVRETLGAQASVLSMDGSMGDPLAGVWKTLATLWASGHAIAWQPFWLHRNSPPKESAATLRVSLNGSNYAKRYPTHAAATLEEIPMPKPSAAPQESTPHVARQQNDSTATPSSTTDPWVHAFQAHQQALSEAHAHFQTTLAESHRTFLQAAESSLRGLQQMIAGKAPDDAPAMPSLPATPSRVSFGQHAAQDAVVSEPRADSLPTHPENASNGVTRCAAPIASAEQESPTVDAQTNLSVRELLLDIVADKTGYPKAMLRFDMTLEAELGIDSIKRVEILSAVAEQRPDLAELASDKIARVQSLEDVAHALEGNPSGHTPQAEETASKGEPAAVDNASDMATILLETIAEKTGYPKAMLKLEMSLESDLGIDSIKRVEILSALRDKRPELPELDAAVLGRLNTVADTVNALLGTNLADTAPQAPEAGCEPAPARPKEAPLLEAQVALIRNVPTGYDIFGHYDGTVWIAGPDHALSDALAGALQATGVRVQRAEVADVPKNAAAVVVLAGLQTPTSVAQARAEQAEIFALAARLASRMEASGGIFVTIHPGDGRFGRSEPQPLPIATLGGLSGLVKTAAIEWPKARVHSIECSFQPDVETIAQRLVQALRAGAQVRELGIDADGASWGPILAPCATTSRSTSRLASGDTIVVSGGARGVTACALQAFAGEQKLRFCILGRTPLGMVSAEDARLQDVEAVRDSLLARAQARGETPRPSSLRQQAQALWAQIELHRNLQVLRDSGCDVDYRAVNVRDAAAVAQTIERWKRDFGPISGLVHGAGVLADKALSAKTRQDFDTVFDTKVMGLHALLTALKGEPLRWIGLFSSVAARFGNAGQADYAMANECLNRVAYALQHELADCTVSAMNFGPWDGGMVQGTIRRLFERRQIALIPPAEGAAFVVRQSQLKPSENANSETVLGGGSALLLDALPSSEDFAARFAVSVDSHPYLQDHAVDGHPVLPMALAIEWLARAARASHPGQMMTEVRDLSFTRRAVLKDFASTSHAFTVIGQRIERPRHGARWRLRLTDAQGSEICHAEVCLGERLLAAPRATPRADEAVASAEQRNIYTDQLFHGPGFHIVDEVPVLAADEAVAHLRNTDAMAWLADGDWHIDVAGVDGALQLALLWFQHVHGKEALPTSMGRFCRYIDGPGIGPLRAQLLAKQHDGLEGVVDVVLSDATGRVVAELRDVHTRPRG